MTVDFQVTIHNRKISTLWDRRPLKLVISETYLQKIHCTDKVHPCAGIRLSSASGSNISPIGILALSTDLGTHKFKQNFIVCRNLRRPLILGQDFHHKFCIGASCNSDRKPFHHKDGKPIVYTRTQKSLAKIHTIEYQEIQPYTITIIKTSLDPSTIDYQDNCLLTADSAFMCNIPNLKFHPTLVNSNNLCNNSNLPLILNNNSDHKMCIPCNIIIGTLETITNQN